MRFKSAEAEAEWATVVELNSDPYGAGAVRYAVKWAETMEQKLDAGESLADMQDRASHEADTEGVTGFMHGWAAGALSRFWQYGDEFRVAYNAGYGVGPEAKDAVNPAIITVNTGGRDIKDVLEEALEGTGARLMTEEETEALVESVVGDSHKEG